MKSLILLSAALLVGCSVDVSHEAENKVQTNSISTSDRSKTAVSVGILVASEPSPETDQMDSATSQATVKVDVPDVVISPPSVVRRPEPTIHISGTANTVVCGDVHLHHHEHKHVHIHKTPKPTPMRMEVRVKMDDRIGEREKRRRMVQKRIFEAFPHYRN